MTQEVAEINSPKRPRGRPRKYPQGEKLRQLMTHEERAAVSRATWTKRIPSYDKPGKITVRREVFRLLDERRAGRSWTVFLCDLAGIIPPVDRRRNRET